MQISKGFGTWAGVVGALGTFVLAIATFMDTFDQLDPLAGLGPLAAAALVFYKVLDGRFNQAVAAIETDRSSSGAPQRRSQHVPSEAEITGWPTTTEPRPSASVTNPDPAYINSIPAGSVPLEGGQ